jgi:hypothetical protein
LADQAEAADSQLLGMLGMFQAANPGGGCTERPGRVLWGLTVGLRDRMMSSTLGLCAHLDARTPAPAFWHPWAPEAVLCSSCASAAHLRIRGTDEDRRCDGCHRLTDRLRPCMSKIPAAVGELADGTPRHRPSIVMAFGLCDRCWEAEQEPFELPPDDAATPGLESVWILTEAVT